MKAAALDVLANRNPFNDRKDAVRRHFEAQCTFLTDHKGELLRCIQDVKHERLIENICEVCADPFIKDLYPRVTEDFLRSLALAFDGKRLSEIASLFMVKPFDYRSGWPDLTVIDSGSVTFIEVKTTDFLHTSQLRFAEEFAKPLRLSCKTVQLQPLRVEREEGGNGL